MANAAFSIDPSRLTTFSVVRANDPSELDTRSRVSERFPEPSRIYKYRLRDRALWHGRFDEPIFTLAVRSAGPIVATYAQGSFETEVAIDGDEGDLFCFTMVKGGHVTMLQNGLAAAGTTSRGIAFRPGPGTRILMSDGSERANVFVKATELEAALEQVLDRRLSRPLAFVPGLDWSGGLSASLKGMLDFVMREFERTDGLADNPVALASATDLLMSLVLRGLPHNHSGEMAFGADHAVPAYVRRAEDYMRARCAEPIRMKDVAAAAGCSMRTLDAVFRRFRDTTPLRALHALRLGQVHAELSREGGGESVAAVARRYGFTNASRFGQAFRRRFGETPADVLRRASRS